MKRISIVVSAILLIGATVSLVIAIMTFKLNKEPLGLILAAIQFSLFASIFVLVCKYYLQTDPNRIRKKWKVHKKTAKQDLKILHGGRKNP